MSNLLGLSSGGLDLLGGLGGVLPGKSLGLGEDSKTLHGSLAEVRAELVLDENVVDGLGVVLEASVLAELHGGDSASGLLGLEVGDGEGDGVLLGDGETLSGEAAVSEGGEVGQIAGLAREGGPVAGATEAVVLANELPDEISGHFFCYLVG